jgi:hypothetical protein
MYLPPNSPRYDHAVGGPSTAHTIHGLDTATRRIEFNSNLPHGMHAQSVVAPHGKTREGQVNAPIVPHGAPVLSHSGASKKRSVQNSRFPYPSNGGASRTASRSPSSSPSASKNRKQNPSQTSVTSRNHGADTRNAVSRNSSNSKGRSNSTISGNVVSNIHSSSPGNNSSSPGNNNPGPSSLRVPSTGNSNPGPSSLRVPNMTWQSAGFAHGSLQEQVTRHGDPDAIDAEYDDHVMANMRAAAPEDFPSDVWKSARPSGTVVDPVVDPVPADPPPRAFRWWNVRRR